MSLLIHLTMNASWHLFDPKWLSAGVIAVVATNDSQPFWAGPVLSILEELAQQFPSSKPNCAFLGGSQLHPIEAVLGELQPGDRPPNPAVSLQANLGRSPVLGPLIRQLETSGPRPVLVVANGPLIDADDWATPEPGRPIAFLRLTGSERIAPSTCVEWSAADVDLAAVVEFLSDPVESVRLGEDGAVALEWQASEYRWDRGRLIAERPQQPVRVRFSGLGSRPPRAQGRRRSGIDFDLPLANCSPEPLGRTVTLAAAECVVLDLWRQRSPYWCADCSRSHAPGSVRCSGGENRLLASLTDVPVGTVCLLTRQVGGWVAETVPNSIFLLDDERVCVWQVPISTLYSRTDAAWEVSDETLGAFPTVGSEQFAIRI